MVDMALHAACQTGNQVLTRTRCREATKPKSAISQFRRNVGSCGPIMPGTETVCLPVHAVPARLARSGTRFGKCEAGVIRQWHFGEDNIILPRLCRPAQGVNRSSTIFEDTDYRGLVMVLNRRCVLIGTIVSALAATGSLHASPQPLYMQGMQNPSALPNGGQYSPPGTLYDNMQVGNPAIGVQSENSSGTNTARAADDFVLPAAGCSSGVFNITRVRVQMVQADAAPQALSPLICSTTTVPAMRRQRVFRRSRRSHKPRKPILAYLIPVIHCSKPALRSAACS